MKLKSVVLVILVSLFIMFPVDVVAQEIEEKQLVERLQKGSKFFELIELNKPGEFTDFEVKLGVSVLTLENGDKFDGFRFKVPDGVDEKDFVWYFNAPTGWAHWYLCPVEGEFEQSFRSWLNAVKVYEKFDRENEENRTRILQALKAGYFKAGQEYIMWFRNIEDGDTRLTGRILFSEPEKGWVHRNIETSLNLKPMSAEVQVKQLQSRGGEILLDKEFFKRRYAERLIDNILFSISRLKHLRGGFFITTQISAGPSDMNPAISEIQKRYGEADFVMTGRERNLFNKNVGDKTDFDPNIITYYYDYCGFEVQEDDVKGAVQKVVTHGENYSDLQPSAEGRVFGRVATKNLTTFSKDGKEVGRMYLFLEGSKKPLVIKSPPKGSYKNGNQTLEFLGSGKWVWTNYYEDGSVARKVPFKRNKMHGKAEGFYANASPKFEASYKNGLLDGKVVEYSKEGKVLRETVYTEGKQ